MAHCSWRKRTARRVGHEGLKRLVDAGKHEMALETEFLRVRAGLQLSLGDRVAAEDSLRQAIVTAQGQQAKFLELLAATDLARLWSAQGKRAEAHELLAPVYGWFTEGLDTPSSRRQRRCWTLRRLSRRSSISGDAGQLVIIAVRASTSPRAKRSSPD